MNPNIKVAMWASIGLSGISLLIVGAWMMSPIAAVILSGVVLIAIAGAMAI